MLNPKYLVILGMNNNPVLGQLWCIYWPDNSHKYPKTLFCFTLWPQHPSCQKTPSLRHLLIIMRGPGLVQHVLQNPSIWTFLQCLKSEQYITDVIITKLCESPEPGSAKWRKYDEKLQTIIQNFGRYPTILNFLKCASYLM